MFFEKVESSTTFAARLSNTDTILENLRTRFNALFDQGLDSAELLPTKEAAILLNLALPTLYGTVMRGITPYSKPGGQYLYPSKVELTEWVKKSCRKTKYEIHAESRKGVRHG